MQKDKQTGRQTDLILDSSQRVRDIKNRLIQRQRDRETERIKDRQTHNLTKINFSY